MLLLILSRTLLHMLSVYWLSFCIISSLKYDHQDFEESLFPEASLSSFMFLIEGMIFPRL